MPFLASEGCFWPIVASMTSEVKNNYAYNIKDFSIEGTVVPGHLLFSK